jgi:hypothetical protein
MTSSIDERILGLLPAVYSVSDARSDTHPGYLQSLLTVIAEQLQIVDADLDQLYDDLFIETCDGWVVPYLGDLVAVVPAAATDSNTVLTRGAVADAIALRRRKGTVAVLEQLARDVTGWPAVAVEMFKHTSVTQHLSHLVPTRGATVDLRAALPLERIDGAFDSAAHTLEARRIGSARGRYDVQNVAIFVWRDIVLTHTNVEASSVDDKRWRFSPIGTDGQLAIQPVSEIGLTHHATPINVPGQLTRRTFAASLDDFYGVGLSVAVSRADGVVDLADVVVCDLSDASATGAGWSNVSRLSVNQLAIDPELGRLAFGAAQDVPPLVSFVTTAPSDTGGSETSGRPLPPNKEQPIPVRSDGFGGVASSIAAGLAAAGGLGTVEVQDSRTYRGDSTVTVPPRGHLRVVSADGAMPIVWLDDQWVVTVGEEGSVSLVGLTVAGGPLVVRGRPDGVEISNCTFVPGQRLGADAQADPPVGPSVILDIDSDWQTTVSIDHSITGPLFVPADGTTLSIVDSIIDGVDDGLGRTASTGASACITPVLRGPNPLGPLALPPGSTTLALILGTDEPLVVDIGALPPDAQTAATLLDAALAGSGARALSADDRVILVGDGRPLSVTSEPGSSLADALGLSSQQAQVPGVRGGTVDLSRATAGGSIAVAVGNGSARVADVPPLAANLSGIAAAVQGALRAVGPDLATVAVGVLDDELVVVPGDDAPITVATTPTDPVTAGALALVSPRPAIAADPAATPGATLTLTRSTVFGDIRVIAVDQISDSIITGTLLCERRQIGCIEYSWVSPASVTPRRHQCQPASKDTPPPSFVSHHFATPGYARLRRPGATAVIRGASNGFEMGALALLQQTQRDDNLRRAIAEFLRFGLEAGVLDGNQVGAHSSIGADR